MSLFALRPDFTLVELSTYREPSGWIPISPTESIPGEINEVTVTLTAEKPWGTVTVSATACGPNDTSLAGWQAFTRLINLKPGVVREDRVLFGDRWETRHIEQEGPAMPDNVTTINPEPAPSPVDQVVAAIEAGTITTGDERRLRHALAEQDTQAASEALNKLGRALSGRKP